jgi:hypothetical protein
MISLMAQWWRMAFERDIALRALKVSCIVGTLLVCINYGDVIFSDGSAYPAWWKIFLTYCVPYLVSTYSGARARCPD